MGNKNTKWRWIVIIAVVWQLIVCALSVGGIFGDIYEWLGIPWNTAGVRNVIGTTIGFVLLELPVIVMVGYALLRQRRRKRETTTA